MLGWLAPVLSSLALLAEPTAGVQPLLEVRLPQAGTRYGLLEVPRLHLRAPIYSGASLRELNKGVGHLDSTYWPGMGGTVALFSHRVTPTLGLPHGPFRYLPRLRSGDVLRVRMPYGTYRYRVVKERIVTATDWRTFRAKLGRETLLLAACHPAGSAAYRYVVKGVLQ